MQTQNNTPILGWEEYLIYNNGSVYSIRNKCFLKIQDNGNGYKKLSLNINGKIKQVYIHRLVAKHFIPNPNNYKYVDHIDRDKTNNHCSNLRWVTASENTRNTAGEPRYSKIRENMPHHPLYIKNWVVELYSIGYKVMEIADILKLPRQTISRFIKSEFQC
jgi:hypothetical protein